MNKLSGIFAITLLLVPMAFAGLDDGIAARERGDYTTALREFKSLAEQGNADAQTYLGSMYIRGQGVPHDFAEALKWYRKAAVQGVPEAQYFLGMTYLQRHGINHDEVKAVKWLRKAAEQGHAQAEYSLGLMYKYGWGVFQDPVEAYKWFSLAAEQGNEDGLRNRAYLEKRMTPEDITAAQELVRTWIPCGTDRQCP